MSVDPTITLTAEGVSGEGNTFPVDFPVSPAWVGELHATSREIPRVHRAITDHCFISAKIIHQLFVRVARTIGTRYNVSRSIGAWRSPVSALAWGARGRRFKSSRPDLNSAYPESVNFRVCCFLTKNANARVRGAPGRSQGESYHICYTYAIANPGRPFPGLLSIQR